MFKQLYITTAGLMQFFKRIFLIDQSIDYIIIKCVKSIKTTNEFVCVEDAML